MTIFRIHIRPRGGAANSEISVAYCLSENVLGVGWQTKSQKNGSTWEEYLREASEIYGAKQLSRVRYLKQNIKKDDLIWTRDTHGSYYLAKVESEWEYYTNEAAQKADIVNVVRCDIRKVSSVDAVPGKVIACFRPTRSIQRIGDPTAADYSSSLWNKMTKTEYYPVSEGGQSNIFSCLNSEETEDVIFIYLQTKGWLVIPNSRKGDTMSYEFYVIHSETRAKGITQVKTGNTPLDRKDYANKAERVFLFQSNGIYRGEEVTGVTCLSPTEIEAFMHENREIMPSSITFWLDAMQRKAVEPQSK